MNAISRDEEVVILSQHLIKCLESKQLTVEEFVALSSVSSSTIRRIIKNDEVKSKFRYSTMIKVQDCIIKLNSQPNTKLKSTKITQTLETFLIIMSVILLLLVFAVTR